MRTWIFTSGLKKTGFKSVQRITNMNDCSTNNQRRWTALTFLGLAFSSYGAEQTNESENALMSPDIELLEFLGSFQTDAGEFIAPESMLGTEFPELLDLATQLDSTVSSDAVEDTQRGNR